LTLLQPRIISCGAVRNGPSGETKGTAKMSDLLAKAVEHTKSGNVSAYATKADLETLLRDGLVEIGPQEKPGSNKFAFRATDAGVRAFEAGNGATALPGGVPAGAASTKGFEIETGIPVPDRARRSGPTGKYPFDALEVGQSFFIPATNEKPEPWKSMQSTVTAAQRRYSTEDGTRVNRNGDTVPNLKPTRRFRLDKSEKDGKQGARVWRTA
jgi:hypothetical protein